LPGQDREAGSSELIVQFRVNQVDLAQIRLVWVVCHPRAMFDRRASMHITLDTQPG